MSNSLHYHSALRALIGERNMIAPERLAEIRTLLPEDEAFQLKYVIVPLNEGIEGQKDMEVLSGHLHNVAMMLVNGMDPEVLQEFLATHETRVKALPPADKFPGHAASPSPSAPARRAPSRQTSPRIAPRATTPPVSRPNQPRIKAGDRLRSRDPRRSRTGVIQDVQGDNIRVQWGKGGASRIIKIQRILHEHRYDLLPA
jgi:hypothetical protein